MGDAKAVADRAEKFLNDRGISIDSIPDERKEEIVQDNLDKHNTDGDEYFRYPPPEDGQEEMSFADGGGSGMDADRRKDDLAEIEIERQIEENGYVEGYGPVDKDAYDPVDMKDGD